MSIRTRIGYLSILPKEVSYSLSSITETQNINFKSPIFHSFFIKSIKKVSKVEMGTRVRSGMSPVVGNAGTVAVAVGEDNFELVR